MQDQKNHPEQEPDRRLPPEADDALAFDELEDILEDLEAMEKALEEEYLLRRHYEEHCAGEGNEIPVDKDGFCTKNEKLCLYDGPGGLVRIPDGVTEIMPFAFEGCKTVTAVGIPHTVREIGEGAFAGCTALEDIIIPEGVEIICSGAFVGCTALRQLRLPDTVREIRFRAFCGCSGLEALRLPDSPLKIEAYAFELCTGLTEVWVPDRVREIDASAFTNCDHLRRVSLSAGFRLDADAFEYCAAEIVYRPAEL